MLIQPCSLVLKFFRSFVVLLFLGSFVSFSFASQLIYSTYLGGMGSEEGNSIAIDGIGNIYITGRTTSTDFPTTAGSFDSTYNSSVTYPGDVFVTKIDLTGTVLCYSTYLGGSNNEIGYGITVDASGNAYITGITVSSDFPTTVGAFDTTFNENCDVFVSKLNSTGTELVYSTYLGGKDNDYIFTKAALDTAGNAYIIGLTGSKDFPTTTNALDTSYHGSDDVFVCKLNQSGTGLIYSTYLGGQQQEWGYGIDNDAAGNVYLTGFTQSPGFPTTIGAYDTSYNGTADVFISKLNPSGTELIYSTFIGGYDGDGGYNIVVDTAGNAFVSGRITSTDFPTTPSAWDTSYNGGLWDTFVSKLNPNGTNLIYSTYLGGKYEDWSYDMVIDGSENVYLVGYTQSSDFPITVGAYDTSLNGIYDAFISKLNPSGTELLYSTYFGGNGNEECSGIAIDAVNNIYITGGTNSVDFPTTAGAFDISFNGGSDVFVTKMRLNPYFNNNGEFTISSDTDYWYFEKYGDAMAPGALAVDTTYGFAAIYQSPGEKGKLTQVFSVTSTGWYTAKAKVWTTIADASKQQKVYLYLQELDENNQVVASGTQVIQSGSGYFGDAWNPKELAISFYAHGTKLAVQVVAINPAGSSETGSLCIDYIRVTDGATIPSNDISLTNPSFDEGTNSWLLQPYGDASYAGVWTTAWSVLALTQDGGSKGKASQLFSLPTTGNNVYASAWVYSDVTSISETQKVYLYLYDYSFGYQKVIDNGNMILQPGTWTPGEWHQLQFVFPASTQDNAIQLVGINPEGNSWATLYFYAVAVKQ